MTPEPLEANAPAMSEQPEAISELSFEAALKRLEEIVRRLADRTVCETCQSPYTGREPGSACDKDGGRLVREAAAALRR